MADSRSDVRFRVSQIDHVELFVPDRDEAAKWYEEVLGLTVLRGYEDWAKDPHGPLMISSDDGSTKLALFEGDPRGPTTTTSFSWWRFACPALTLSSSSRACRMSR